MAREILGRRVEARSCSGNWVWGIIYTNGARDAGKPNSSNGEPSTDPS
jgi:hypothetical protein